MINRRKFRNFFVPKKNTITPVTIKRENPFKRSIAQLPNGECLMKGEDATVSANIAGVKLYTIPPETPGERMEHPFQPLVRRPRVELNYFVRVIRGGNECLGILQPHNYRLVELPTSNYIYDAFSISGGDYASTAFFRKLGKLGLIAGNIFFDDSKKVLSLAYHEQFWSENTQEWWVVYEDMKYKNAPFYRFLVETRDAKLNKKESKQGQGMIVFQDVSGWTGSYQGEVYAWRLNFGYPYSLGYPFDIGRDEEGNLYLVSARKLIFENDFTDTYPFTTITRDQYKIEEIHRPPKDWGYGTVHGQIHNQVDFHLYVYKIDKQTLKIDTDPIIDVPYYQADLYIGYYEWENGTYSMATVDNIGCFKNFVYILLYHTGFRKPTLFIFNYLTGEKVFEISPPGDRQVIDITTDKIDKFITFGFRFLLDYQNFIYDEFGNCVEISGFRNENEWDGDFINKEKSDSKEVFMIRATDKKLLRVITHGSTAETVAEIEVAWVNATSTLAVNKLFYYQGRVFYSDYRYKDVYEVFPYFDEDTQTWKSFQQLLYNKRDGYPVKIINGYMIMSNMKTFFIGKRGLEEVKIIMPEGATYNVKLAYYNHQNRDIRHYTGG